MTVVGLGATARGDDGVGVAVIDALRADPPPGVTLVTLGDAAPLVDRLDGRDVVLVDAVRGLGAPGTLRWLEPADLARVGAWSTHGVSVPDAIGLAEVIHGPGASARLRVLGVAIGAARPSLSLTAPVAAAVPLAAAEIHRLSEARMHESMLAHQLVRAVLDHLPDGHRATRVRGWLGETEALDADSLKLHFETCARGTAAEGASLELELVHVRARCEGCGHVYRPENHVVVCPTCGGLEATLLDRAGIGLHALDVLER